MAKSDLDTPVFIAIIQSFTGDIRDLFRNRVAFFGGIGGSTVVFALLIVSLIVISRDANADDNEELEIDFVPGSLVKLGQKPPEEDIPEKIITRDTRAEEEAAAETVTEDEKQKPKDIEKEEKPTKDKPKRPTDKKDNKLPTSDTPTDKNTPYDDLPTVDYNIGDPFGSADGWSNRMEDGDPWATAVMKALNNLQVGSYMAEAKDGNYKFQLSVCKDGRITDVRGKGGSLPQDVQNRIDLALQRVKVPTPPAEVLKKMRSQCAKIRYTFVWNGQVIR